VRLVEVVGALSLATDAGMGAPLELGLGTCLIAGRLAEGLGCSPEERGRVYYVALLRHIGCTAGSHEFAAVVGDELAFRGGLGRTELSQGQMLREVLRAVVRDEPPLGKLRALARLAGHAGALKEGSLAVCEVAGRLAGELGFGPEVQRDIAEVYERWDGHGFPSGIPARDTGVPARVVAVAEAVEIFLRLDGAAAAASVLRERAGRAYDPAVAGYAAEHALDLAANLDRDDLWGEALACEPAPRRALDAAGVERALCAAADFADLKSPYTVGHSRGVADLVSTAAAGDGGLRAAALVHDLGRVGVSSALWGKPGPLSRAEWERVRLHPYTTERVLDRAESLRPIARLAAAHHERLDGSGYHRAVPAAALSHEARLLAAADALHAMTEPRPHRPALAPEAAAAQLQAEVRAGRHDADAVAAVVQAAGGGTRRRRPQVAGLTAREVEVLKPLARGLSTPAIARELVIARKTADAHIQHIYAKAGVSTRPAATLFAAQHGLLETLET
jgi:HD-GYP domain-containing protein (c-di-GMP phosphodiesterase class II)